MVTVVKQRQMVNQSQANQPNAQVQHTQSPQQSQSPQQQAKTQILQQFTPSIQLQSAGGTGQQQYGKVVITLRKTDPFQNS